MCTVSFKTSAVNASQSLNRTLLNQNNQIKIGFSDDCITIRSDFNNDNKLVGKAFVKTQSCSKETSVEQSFKQIYYDENDQDKFAICLAKYYDGPIDATNWLPRFYCLIGSRQLVKVLKAKSLNQIKDDLKWQWSYNEEKKLINYNTIGRYDNTNGRFMSLNKSKEIKLLPNHLSTINNFGSHSFSVSNDCANNIKTDNDACSEDPCQNSGRCVDETDGYTCY